MTVSVPKPIIFLGPSLPIETARKILPIADYRPPIKRGDLDNVEGGTVVGIIDGIFGDTLAISPTEIRKAIARGAVVYGAASMGALRAAEIPEVIAIGQVAEMYRSGTIERDDEVALLFAPETYIALTQPLVNLRYGVSRLVRSGTINHETGHALVEASANLHFSQRTLENIIANSPLAKNHDADDVIRLLRGFDLKREDAQALVETLVGTRHVEYRVSSAQTSTEGEGLFSHPRVQRTVDHDSDILIWESGDRIKFSDLLHFLMFTGRFDQVVRNVVSRLSVSGMLHRVDGAPLLHNESAYRASDGQLILDATRLMWGWESPEEAHVTLRDIGLGLRDIASTLEAEVRAEEAFARFAESSPPEFLKSFRVELWLNNLMLKREALRLGALNYFAAQGATCGPLTEADRRDAQRTIARLRSAMQWQIVIAELSRFGISHDALDDLVDKFALARRAAAAVIGNLDCQKLNRPVTQRAERWRKLGLQFDTNQKPEDTDRFACTLTEAQEKAEDIARRIGITRIGMIGELDTLGIHVAQAFGQRNSWSTSFSSGKSESRAGARIGSIMEEVEIFAQDSFHPEDVSVHAYADVRDDLRFVNPAALGLPFDSRYSDTLDIEWVSVFDLLTCARVFVPLASVMGDRRVNDIYYSHRLGGKFFSSSGLGSGFTLAEAAVHAAAEFIERHAVRLAEIEIDNPGGVGIRQFEFIDPMTLPDTPKRIVQKYTGAGMAVRILDITSEIAVPTFYARVFDDPFDSAASTTSDGYASHPNPEVAITMALLEAAQTKVGLFAGGREDYALHARSLGRHERPRTMLPKSQAFWFCNDPPMRKFDTSHGLYSRDILEEMQWMVDRVEDAGLQRLLLSNYATDKASPAHVVRISIPEAETANPLYTGPRGRATLIRDILPRRTRCAR
jgi:ribosomal protein S12 methylthiotransferase accessory factor